MAGLVTTYGAGAMTNSIPEIREAEFLFVTGSNTTEAHPIIAMEMKRAVRRGAKLAVGDPRAIWLTEIADWHLQRAAFAWDVPEDFNMAQACCDSWADLDPDRIALTHLDADLTPKDWSFRALKDASDRFAAHLRAQGCLLYTSDAADD